MSRDTLIVFQKAVPGIPAMSLGRCCAFLTDSAQGNHAKDFGGIIQPTRNPRGSTKGFMETAKPEALRLADMNEKKGERLQPFIDDNEFTEFGYRPEGLKREQSDLFANAAELRRLHSENASLTAALFQAQEAAKALERSLAKTEQQFAELVWAYGELKREQLANQAKTSGSPCSELVAEAVKAEREACVLLAYSYPAPDAGGSWRESIAAAIRARGQA